ncbi:MAG: thioredoxin-disulfide reductase [Lachnospiraceae bacterium]|nr:thioredoxin-disulfide reductase [Lachnospiraceae bacterium]
MRYDVIIIGNGPAGLTAAIYGVRAGLKTLLLSDSPQAGGQIATTYEIDNYPGLPGLGGMELGDKFEEHAKKLGAEFAVSRVSDIVPNGSGKDLYYTLKTDHDDYETRTVIIATGADHRKLGVPGEGELTGMGVSYCATCDGAFFRNKTVAVVGGGDVALEDAIFLSRFAAKVYLIHRRDEFRGAFVLQEQVKANEKIEIIYDTVVDAIEGKMAVEKLKLSNKKTGEKTDLAVNGVFMAVGIIPNLEGLSGLPQQNEAGYIIADETCSTNLPGIYAAGDVRTKQLRQVITAAADGANAITSIEGYLNSIA